MRIYEVISAIKPLKPLTPDQQRINSLKQQKDKAGDALKAERERQKMRKATEKLHTAQQTLAKL